MLLYITPTALVHGRILTGTANGAPLPLQVVPAPGSPAGVCQVTVHVAVPFSKSCLMRGIIHRTTISENKVFFGKLVEAAQKLAGGAAPAPHSSSSSSSSSVEAGGACVRAWEAAAASVHLDTTVWCGLPWPCTCSAHSPLCHTADPSYSRLSTVHLLYCMPFTPLHA
jgi:hypothetical protein